MYQILKDQHYLNLANISRKGVPLLAADNITVDFGPGPILVEEIE